MKNFWIRKLLGMDQRLQIRYPYPHHTTLTYRTRDLPPPDRLSGNHPEPVKLPVEFCFTSSLSYCLVLHCIVIIAVYLLSPPFSADSRYERYRCFPPCVRLLRGRPCTATVELPGK